MRAQLPARRADCGPRGRHLDHQPVRLRTMRQLRQCLPQKCLAIVPGYTAPGTEKRSETFNRPAPPAAQAGKAGGKPVNDPAACVYCTLCAKKCPQGAITVDRAAKSWKLDAEACVGCGICAASCPKKCLQLR